MLYVIRHGITDWNVIHKLQGQTDIPLNEEGRKMAKLAGIENKDVKFDVCYASPLCRALETAKLFLEGRDIPIIVDDRLKEISFGIMEGLDNPMKTEDSPINKFFFEPQNYVPAQGGESFEELFSRTGSFLKEVVDPLLQANKSVLIVGHGAMNSSIVCQVKDIPLERFWEMGIKNCKLMRLI